MRPTTLLFPLLVAVVPTLAAAQSSQGRRSAPASEPEIVVSGQAPAAQTAIDRKTYPVSHDLQAAAGSVAEILRNLPSVEVDAEGNVSLRGDQSVQILIDGKPSTAMNGANRAETLQQLSASSIERVEIITNPSAQYKPDGSSGAINIITRRSHKSGRAGSAQASAGTDGRFSIGVTGTYSKGPLSLNGGLTVKRDVARRPFSDRRTQYDAATGQSLGSSQDSLFLSKRLLRIATAGLDYDFTPADRLSAAISYSLRTGHPLIQEHDLVADAAGMTTADYDRTGFGSERETNTEGSIGYRHSFDQKGHELSVELRRSESAETQHRRYTSVYRTPPGLITITDQSPRADEIERELSIDYARPLAGGGKLKLGYDLDRNDDVYDNRGGFIEPLNQSVVLDPASTNRFVYDRTIHALYATLEHSIGKRLHAIVGLRLEDTILHTNQVTSQLLDRSQYFRAYPTLHLEYDLSGRSTLRFSYSHRVARPEPEDLNPYPTFQDPQNVRAGNPRLLPQETHSLEAGFEYNHRGTSLGATAYLRKSYNGFTEVSQFISPNVLLTTKENLGRSTAAGLELTASGKLSAALSYNLSANLFYNQIDAANLGVAVPMSAFSYTAKGSLDYHLSPKDLLQVSANLAGKRLIAQGYRHPSGALNLGYRHQIRSDLALVLTVSDLLDTQRDQTVKDTPTLHDVAVRRRSSRMASIALSWNFGGAKKAKEPQFDYTTEGGSSK